MLKIYFENTVISAITRRDYDKAEQDAIDQLIDWARANCVVIGTSCQSPREMERAPSEYQAKLKTGLSEPDLAKDDHKVLGFHMQMDQLGGWISSPLVTDIIDEPLYSDLLAAGLKSDDAKHLMYAVHNGYQRFVTLDRDFLKRRVELEKHCPSIRILSPSECLRGNSGCEKCRCDPILSHRWPIHDAHNRRFQTTPYSTLSCLRVPESSYFLAFSIGYRIVSMRLKRRSINEYLYRLFAQYLPSKIPLTFALIVAAWKNGVIDSPPCHLPLKIEEILKRNSFLESFD